MFKCISVIMLVFAMGCVAMADIITITDPSDGTIKTCTTVETSAGTIVMCH